MTTAPAYYSADCRFGGHDACREGKQPTRLVEGLVYLVCTCPCHTTLERREAAMRAAREQQQR